MVSFDARRVLPAGEPTIDAKKSRIILHHEKRGRCEIERPVREFLLPGRLIRDIAEEGGREPDGNQGQDHPRADQPDHLAGACGGRRSIRCQRCVQPLRPGADGVPVARSWSCPFMALDIKRAMKDIRASSVRPAKKASAFGFSIARTGSAKDRRCLRRAYIHPFISGGPRCSSCSRPSRRRPFAENVAPRSTAHHHR